MSETEVTGTATIINKYTNVGLAMIGSEGKVDKLIQIPAGMNEHEASRFVHKQIDWKPGLAFNEKMIGPKHSGVQLWHVVPVKEDGRGDWERGEKLLNEWASAKCVTSSRRT